MGYFLKLHPRTRRPEQLLRTRDVSAVDRWDGNAWQETALSQAQIAGLGGDSDCYEIMQFDVEKWQKKLPAS